MRGACSARGTVRSGAVGLRGCFRVVETVCSDTVGYAGAQVPGLGICRILTMHVLIKDVHSFFVRGVRCLCASQIQYHFDC